MKKLLFALLLLTGCYCQAAVTPADTPAWLEQLAATKEQAPEHMLSQLDARQHEFSQLNAAQQAYWLNQQAAIFSYLGQYSQQQAAAEQGLALLHGQENPALQAELLFELGYAREMQLAFNDALNAYQRGASLAAESANIALQIRGIINIAAIDSLQDRDQLALQQLKHAYHLAETLQDNAVLADVNAQLGLLYSSLGFEHEAQEFLERALTLYADLGWQKNRISVLYNLARNYGALKNYEQAQQSFNLMLQAAQQENDKLNLYYAYSGLAITSNDMAQPQKALNYMEKAEEYLTALEAPYYLAGHHYEKALIYQKLQQNTQAMQQLLLAEQHFQQLPDEQSASILLAGRLLKSELLAEQGQYAGAYEQLRGFVRAFQQFRDKENELALAQAKMTFETERAAARQSMQQQEHQLKALELSHSKQIQWMWLALLVLLGMLVILSAKQLLATRRNSQAISTALQQDKA